MPYIASTPPASTQRFAAGVAYQGSHTHGWAKQPAHPSVQETLEHALSRIANQPITTVCAGRTDAGVHAMQQVIHFDGPRARTATQWLHGSNRYLPHWISLQWVKPVSNDFHARFSATSRSYGYCILQHQTPLPLFHQRMLWHRQPLNTQAMQQAAQHWLGEHDFSSFRDKHCQSNSPFRNLMSFNIQDAYPNIVVCNIQANAFLHHMIRNFIGVLLAIGRMQRPTSWAKEVLMAKDRSQAGVTAPAHGLYFYTAHYPSQFDIPKPIPTWPLPSP